MKKLLLENIKKKTSKNLTDEEKKYGISFEKYDSIQKAQQSTGKKRRKK